MSSSQIVVNGIRPLAITKAQFYKVIAKPRICQRALFWTRRGMNFVEIVEEGGRGKNLLIDTESVERFYEDWRAGRRIPPLLPNESDQRKDVE